MSKNLIILIGPPFSGKSTQLRNFERLDGNLEVFSMGKMLRSLIDSDLEKYSTFHEIMNNGQLLPDDFINNAFSLFVNRSQADLLIIEGFPLTLEQLKLLDKLIFEGMITIRYYFYLHTPEESIKSRLNSRRLEENNREDDQESDIFEQRLKVFNNNAKQVIDVISERKEFVQVDNSKSKAEVWAEISGNL